MVYIYKIAPYEYLQYDNAVSTHSKMSRSGGTHSVTCRYNAALYTPDLDENMNRK